MTHSSFQPERKPSALPARLEELRQELKNADPTFLAENTGASFQPSGDAQGDFSLLLWDRQVRVSFPGWIAYDETRGLELSLDVQALLLYHFKTSRGHPPSGRWISFAELPDGKFYQTAFQGYTGAELARFFQADQEKFEQAGEKAGGQRETLGNASYSFTALPKVRLLVVYWQGDEDFPASIQVLFDAAVVHHLPTDVCAILGSMLASRIKKSAV